MIQRIQSVFLAASMLFISLVFGAKLCDFHFPDSKGEIHESRLPNRHLESDHANVAQMSMRGFVDPQYAHLNTQVLSPIHYPFLLLITTALFILSAVALFSYRNRPLQIKLCTIAFFINIILLGYLFISPDLLATKLSNCRDMGLDKTMARKMVHYQWGSFFPFLSLIFLNLASRFIKKDEAMIRAAERLR